MIMQIYFCAVLFQFNASAEPPKCKAVSDFFLHGSSAATKVSHEAMQAVNAPVHNAAVKCSKNSLRYMISRSA